ncbi:Putative Holliday junction resolvase [Candidatus Westeberhardia cardiocondylae]|uniref:Putative pre-16S rRNA nuclease n=1 Tax=Candidatus Westeberhardia cardiocondylae TaxID=1594731 RepID=A0A0H5BWZ2_9ENTR|nr:Holliday junction resolvase RuvX [Candidatus Westeberhardia cardiocondylae]MCR3756393.1 ribonuclease H-like domain containing nuclease [Candidatus Westeberhardia cardiocondylae]CEN32228.1 Putative Holliday junction resolvase [Candidatus Westeberhardia cardiocondylae]
MNKCFYILGLDVGTLNVGVAISQNVTKIAYPLGTFKIFRGIFYNWGEMDKIFDEWKLIHTIVVGLPLNMDGTEQNFTFEVKKFSNRLQNRFNCRVVLHDERLSTFEARCELLNNRKNRRFNKKLIDAKAAAVILESWLQQEI